MAKMIKRSSPFVEPNNHVATTNGGAVAEQPKAKRPFIKKTPETPKWEM